MKNLLTIAYSGYVYLTFFLFVPVGLLYYFGVSLLPEKKRLLLIYGFNRLWIGAWELLTGIRFVVHGNDLLDPSQTYVFTPNHSNILDVLIAGSRIRHAFRSLMKQEMFRLPVMGWLFDKICIPVDRSSKESRKDSLYAMVNHLRRGVSVLVFPEGTRNRTEVPLKRFYEGAFNIAIAAQVPVLPMVIVNSRDLQPVESMLFYPGTAALHILQPISTEGMTEADISRLSAETYDRMEAAILAYDARFQAWGRGAVSLG